MPNAVESLHTHTHLHTVHIRMWNISTLLDQGFGACNMGFNVFWMVFHAIWEVEAYGHGW